MHDIHSISGQFIWSINTILYRCRTSSFFLYLVLNSLFRSLRTSSGIVWGDERENKYVSELLEAYVS